MSQIAQFFLMKGGEKLQELPDAGCSGEVYTVLLSHLEEKLEFDCRTDVWNDDLMDCAEFDLPLARNVLKEVGNSAEEVAGEIAREWELPQERVEAAWKALLSYLTQVTEEVSLRYELF